MLNFKLTLLLNLELFLLLSLTVELLVFKQELVKLLSLKDYPLFNNDISNVIYINTNNSICNILLIQEESWTKLNYGF